MEDRVSEGDAQLQSDKLIDERPNQEDKLIREVAKKDQSPEESREELIQESATQIGEAFKKSVKLFKTLSPEEMKDFARQMRKTTNESGDLKGDPQDYDQTFADLLSKINFLLTEVERNEAAQMIENSEETNSKTQQMKKYNEARRNL